MIKEKNSLLTANLIQRGSKHELKNSLYESCYYLFCIIMENPIENFWFECFNILSGYLQLIAYQFDSIVNH